MEAMLTRSSLRAINQAMLPYIHFLLPATITAAGSEEEKETRVEAAGSDCGANKGGDGVWGPWVTWQGCRRC
jgi:hypothetical protein